MPPDCSADVLDIGFILIQRQPEVRRKLLELWIARLPKCDWRQFKLLGLKLAQRFTNGYKTIPAPAAAAAPSAAAAPAAVAAAAPAAVALAAHAAASATAAAAAAAAAAAGATAGCRVSAYPWLPEAARQLGRDLQQLLPEWMIEGMLSDFDRHAQRPFLFDSVDPPKPPPEGSPQALCADSCMHAASFLGVTTGPAEAAVKKHMQQQIEEATRAFQHQPSVDELTGEAVG
ncbi:hypothetical protein Emed_003901 [Eimeria media]